MRFCVLSLLTLLFGAGCGENPHPGRDLNVVYGDSNAVDVVRQSQAVNVYRLPRGSIALGKLSDYGRMPEPISLPAGQVSKLRSILLNPLIYGTDHPKGCIPDYGVRFQFQHEGKDVDVMLCFQCEMIGVYRDGVSGHIDSFENGSRQLAAFLLEIFPDDAEIQSLQQAGSVAR